MNTAMGTSPAAPSPHELVEQHRKLVYFVTRKFTPHVTDGTIDEADLHGLGMEALVVAAKGYKPELGFAFATYACRVIWQLVHRGIMNEYRSVRIPEAVYNNEQRIKNAAAALMQEQEPVTPAAIAERAGIGITFVTRYLASPQVTCSVDEPCRYGNSGAPDSATFADVLVDHGADSPEQVAEARDTRRWLYAGLDTLSAKDRLVVTLYYGLEGHEPHTHEQIEHIAGLGRTCAHHVHNRAIKQMRAYFQERDLLAA